MKTEKTLYKLFLPGIHEIVMSAFGGCGCGDNFGPIIRSNFPKLAHYQFDCFAAAKTLGLNPYGIAEKVAEKIGANQMFKNVTATKPGYVNLSLTDEYITNLVFALMDAKDVMFNGIVDREKVVIDFGGANVAKPLHVGHLRSAIIGESLKRIGRYIGHDVIGDIHLGDWGLQMGMVINAIYDIFPDLPYFDKDFTGDYPLGSPVTMHDLDSIYPEASKKAKADEKIMAEARLATVQLHSGLPGYRALWKRIVEMSVESLRVDYAKLGVEYDLWQGESDVHDLALEVIRGLANEGKAVESEGALIINVGTCTDIKPLPPLILRNSGGALLYGATDLATIKKRIDDMLPSHILYVVDKRQALHLEQVFRAAKITGIAGESTVLEHIEFGTMNGMDNKPFKTRAGGTMKLNELIDLIINVAKSRLDDVVRSTGINDEEEMDIAQKVGIATLKFADLSNHRGRDYVFNVERFSAFEGHTGPYLLYSLIRANSILAKARDRGFFPGKQVNFYSDIERGLALRLLEFPKAVYESWNERAPKILCDFAYDLASDFNMFYHGCPVLSEKNQACLESRLYLVKAAKKVLRTTLDLLGIDTPERM